MRGRVPTVWNRERVKQGRFDTAQTCWDEITWAKSSYWLVHWCDADQWPLPPEIITQWFPGHIVQGVIKL